MVQAYFFLLFYTSEILFPVFEACFEEIREAANVFVVRIRAREGLSVVVKQHVEGLRVRAELGALQVTPFVAHGAQCGGLPVFEDFNLLG